MIYVSIRPLLNHLSFSFLKETEPDLRSKILDIRSSRYFTRVSTLSHKVITVSDSPPLLNMVLNSTVLKTQKPSK